MVSLKSFILLIALLSLALSDCPKGSVQSPTTGHCIQCGFPCLECSRIAQLFVCTKYADGFNSTGYQYCYEDSSSLYYDQSAGVCRRDCDSGCNGCSKGDYTHCTSCAIGHALIGNTCVNLAKLVIVCMTFLIVIFLIQAFNVFWTLKSQRGNRGQQLLQ